MENLWKQRYLIIPLKMKKVVPETEIDKNNFIIFFPCLKVYIP